ncbi:tRNA pseudouridine(55) synthase TruB [Ureaplasma miroungigenitalium]|uniref:tRNA pseudouridine(55) synthase TruB n=1 Tax=Ureaplasma miroungigenitalium TaxID=1042321 RepID=UPI0021E7DE18|nr:tRNA pseudouridine(55) synthase TruB [Ureaplasma miroungigenitalium]MCV3734532.1 tRNA pseudouridine(55) synthase TruB [Ureaplasma miroungigenitalium]
MSKKNILVINKPLDWTSFDVVNKLKYLLKVKKIGHAGTLDPNATGVLIIGINQGTKLLGQLTLDEKEYVADILFNVHTDTYDIVGNVLYRDEKKVNLEMIQKAMEIFVQQDYHQTPPMHSAIKINGKKAYDFARKNIHLELPSRLVQIKEYEIISFTDNILKIRLLVSKGFYIRSFAVDLAKQLNTYATLKNLIRTRSGEFSLEDAMEIEEVYDYWTQQQEHH